MDVEPPPDEIVADGTLDVISVEELSVPVTTGTLVSPDEMVADGTLDVTSVEELSVPDTTGELVVLLLAAVCDDSLSVLEAMDVEADCPTVSELERLVVPGTVSEVELLVSLTVDESTVLSLFDSVVERELPCEKEDVDEAPGMLGLSRVPVEGATDGDGSSYLVDEDGVVETLISEPSV